ncbi:hypothetical protein ACHAXS_012492 [Conticribra weissflogii]
MPFTVTVLVAAFAVFVGIKFTDHRLSEQTLRKTGFLLFQPDKYQGARRRSRYFEGWYYKFVSPTTSPDSAHQSVASSHMSMAVVPGIFYGNSTNSNESHAFIFVTLNGERQHYYRFGLDEFSYASSKGSDEFFIQVGENRFTHSGVSLNLYPRQVNNYGSRDDANLILKGELQFTNPHPWPVSLFELGCMGHVGWIPNLECTHGVLSFDHVLHGSITFTNVNNEDMNSTQSLANTTISMDEGRGYTEKDFGRSFPSLWIWIQTNSFRNNPGTSLFVSLARIPTPIWGLEFPGFAAAIWHDKTLIPFATWSGAKFENLRITDEEVFIAMRSSKNPRNYEYRVELTVSRDAPEVLLYAPVNFTKMEPFVHEALLARVHLRLFNGHGGIIFDDIGENAGLEVHGDVKWLENNLCESKSRSGWICL